MDFKEYIVDLNADCKCGCQDLHRLHDIFHFPNDYGASVIANPHQEGFDDTGFRVMLIGFDDPETYHPEVPAGFERNVVECPDWDSVVDVLRRLYDLPKL